MIKLTNIVNELELSDGGPSLVCDLDILPNTIDLRNIRYLGGSPYSIGLNILKDLYDFVVRGKRDWGETRHYLTFDLNKEGTLGGIDNRYASTFDIIISKYHKEEDYYGRIKSSNDTKEIVDILSNEVMEDLYLPGRIQEVPIPVSFKGHQPIWDKAY